MPQATLGRRQLLRVLGAATAAALAGCAGDEALAPVSSAAGDLFSAEELAAIDALADVVLPPDDQPGGAALGAQAYIVRLLTAFDVMDAAAPAYHAGGPYSGRLPLPGAHGDASKDFPPNDFARFLPLDRVAERAARLLILGSAGVEGGGPNDAVAGPIVGLRDLMKQGLEEAIAYGDTPLGELDVDARATLFSGLDRGFQDAFIELVCEAAFAAPEYGGNPNLAGWRMVHFEGDAMPLGYSLYDPSTDSYHERADAPVSLPNPHPDPEPMDADTEDFVKTAAILSGGQVFS